MKAYPFKSLLIRPLRESTIEISSFDDPLAIFDMLASPEASSEAVVQYLWDFGKMRQSRKVEPSRKLKSSRGHPMETITVTAADRGRSKTHRFTGRRELSLRRQILFIRRQCPPGEIEYLAKSPKAALASSPLKERSPNILAPVPGRVKPPLPGDYVPVSAPQPGITANEFHLPSHRALNRLKNHADFRTNRRRLLNKSRKGWDDTSTKILN